MDTAQEILARDIANLKAILPPGDRLALRMEASFLRVCAEMETLRFGSSLTAKGGPADSLWAGIHFTGHERMVLESLWSVKGEILSREGLLAKLYFDKPDIDWPEVKIVDVFVCKVRKKLIKAGANCWIETCWGLGYKIHEGEMPDTMRSPEGEALFRQPSDDYAFAKDYKRRKALGLVRPKAKKGEGKWSISDKESFLSAASARAEHGIWKPRAA